MLNDYDIKMDGKKNVYEGGAIRYSKNKGRFDLIQPIVVDKLIDHVKNCLVFHISTANLIKDIFNGEFIEAIIGISVLKYCDFGKDNNREPDYLGDPFNINHVTNQDVMRCVMIMLKDLAIHFQKGAEKYGERNCEKGIPAWSFHDSAIRHTCQFLLGEHDEPHHISAVWNCWLGVWTRVTHPELCTDINNTECCKNETDNNKNNKPPLRVFKSKIVGPDDVSTVLKMLKEHGHNNPRTISSEDDKNDRCDNTATEALNIDKHCDTDMCETKCDVSRCYVITKVTRDDGHNKPIGLIPYYSTNSFKDMVAFLVKQRILCQPPTAELPFSEPSYLIYVKNFTTNNTLNWYSIKYSAENESFVCRKNGTNSSGHNCDDQVFVPPHIKTLNDVKTQTYSGCLRAYDINDAIIKFAIQLMVRGILTCDTMMSLIKTDRFNTCD